MSTDEIYEMHECVESFPNDKFMTLENSKSMQMTILNLMKNGWKFSIRVENTVGKGEIASEQFLIFP